MKLTPFLLGFALSSAALANEPPGFKGLVIGAPYGEIATTHPQFECSGQGGDAYCMVLADRQCRRAEKYLDDCPKAQERLGVCRRDPAWAASCRRVNAFMSFAGVTIDSVVLNYFDGRLARIRIPLPMGGFYDAADALAAKYGPPQAKETRQMQNRAGAVFDSARWIWRLPGGTIVADEMAHRIDEGAVEFQSPTLEADFARRRGSKAASGASDL